MEKREKMKGRDIGCVCVCECGVAVGDGEEDSKKSRQNRQVTI